MTSMNEYLNDRIREIGISSSDSEKAHSLEDELHIFVLTKIHRGDFGTASEWAGKALETQKYNFSRWCA